MSPLGTLKRAASRAVLKRRTKNSTGTAGLVVSHPMTRKRSMKDNTLTRPSSCEAGEFRAINRTGAHHTVSLRTSRRGCDRVEVHADQDSGQTILSKGGSTRARLSSSASCSASLPPAYPVVSASRNGSCLPHVWPMQAQNFAAAEAVSLGLGAPPDTRSGPDRNFAQSGCHRTTGDAGA